MEVDRLPDGRPLAQLSLAEIKEQCALRNLPKNGSRKDLTDRLKLRLELEKLREEASRALAKEDVVPNIGLQDTPVGQSDIVRQYLEAQQRRLLLFGVHRPHFENTAPIQETTPSDERKRPVAQKTKASLKQSDLLSNTSGATRNLLANADGSILEDFEETTSSAKATRGRAANHKLKVDDTPTRKNTRNYSNDASNSIPKALEDSAQLGPKRRRVVRGSPIQAEGQQTPIVPEELTPQSAESKEVKRGRGRPRKIKESPAVTVLRSETVIDQDGLSDPKVDNLASCQVQPTVNAEADKEPIVLVSDNEDNRTTRAKRLRSQEETPRTLQERARVPPPADPASSEASLEDPIEAALLAMHGVEDATKSPKIRNLSRSTASLDSPTAETAGSRERSKSIKLTRTKELPPIAKETSRNADRRTELVEEKESKEVFAKKSTPISGSPRQDVKRTGGNDRMVRETRKRSKVENIVQKLTQDKVEAADIAAKEASLAKRPRKENGQTDNSKTPETMPPSSGVSPDECVLRLLGAGPKLEKSEKRPQETPKTSREKKTAQGSPRDKRSKEVIPSSPSPTSRRTRRGLSGEGVDPKSESEASKTGTEDVTNPEATIDPGDCGRRDSVEAAVAALIGEPLEPRTSEDSTMKRATRKPSREMKPADEHQQQLLQQQSSPAAVSQPSTRSTRSLRPRETSTEAETAVIDCPQASPPKQKAQPKQESPGSKTPRAAPAGPKSPVEISQAVVEAVPPSKLEQVVAKCETRRTSARKTSSEGTQSKIIEDIKLEQSIKPDAAVEVATATIQESPRIEGDKLSEIAEPSQLDERASSEPSSKAVFPSSKAVTPSSKAETPSSESRARQDTSATLKDDAMVVSRSEKLQGQLERTTHNSDNVAVTPDCTDPGTTRGALKRSTHNEESDADPDALEIVENDEHFDAQQSVKPGSVVDDGEDVRTLQNESAEILGEAQSSKEDAERATANHQQTEESEVEPEAQSLLDGGKDIASDIEQEVSSKPQPEQDDLWEAVFCGDQEGNPSSDWPEGNNNEDPSSSYRQSDPLDDTETNISDTPGRKLPHKFQPNVESAVASILDLNDIMRPSSSLSSHGGQNDNDTAVIDNVPDADSAVAGLLSEVPFDDEEDHADLCIDDEVVSESVAQEYEEAVPGGSAEALDPGRNPSEVGDALQEVRTRQETPERRISEEVRSVTGDVVESVATTSLLVDVTEQQQQPTPTPEVTEQTYSAPLGAGSPAKPLETPHATTPTKGSSPQPVGKTADVKGSVNLSEESSSDSDSDDLNTRNKSRGKQRAGSKDQTSSAAGSGLETARRKTAIEPPSRASVHKPTNSRSEAKGGCSSTKLLPSAASSSSSSSSSSGASSSESSSSDEDYGNGHRTTKSPKSSSKPSGIARSDAKSLQTTKKKSSDLHQGGEEHSDRTDPTLKSANSEKSKRDREEISRHQGQAKRLRDRDEGAALQGTCEEGVGKQRGKLDEATAQLKQRQTQEKLLDVEVEESRKKQEGHAERLRKQQEAEAESLRMHHEEEAVKLRKQQEDRAGKLRKQQDEEAEEVRIRLEEEQKLRKRKVCGEKMLEQREPPEGALKQLEVEGRSQNQFKEGQGEKAREQMDEGAQRARVQPEEEAVQVLEEEDEGEARRKSEEEVSPRAKSEAIGAEQEKARRIVREEGNATLGRQQGTEKGIQKDEAEELREQQEEAKMRMRDEEAARLRKQQEAEEEIRKEGAEKLRKQQEAEEEIRKEGAKKLRKQQEEAERRMREEGEEAASLRKLQEAEKRMREEEAEKLRKLQEEEERKRQAEAEEEQAEEQRKRLEEEDKKRKRLEEEEAECKRRAETEKERKRQDEAEKEREQEEEAERERKLQEEAEEERRQREVAQKEREQLEKAEKEHKQLEEAERERDRQEEAERGRKRKELEESSRKRLEEEESLRIQREVEENSRKQREEEESLRKQREKEKILRKQQEEEASLRKQQEDNLRKQQEQEASLRKQQEDNLRKQQEEEASLRKQQEEEESLRKQQEEEESLRKQREEEESLRKQQEEKLRKQQEKEESLRKQQEEEESLRKQQEEEESLRKQQEEEESLRKQQEEEASLRKQQEEEESLRKQQEEEESLRKKQEEEESLRKKQEEEESRRKQKEEEESLRQQQEEEASLRKQQEEEASLRKQQEEEASLRKQQEASLRQRQEEEARLRQRQEEEARLRKQQEENLRKQQEEEASLQKQREEEVSLQKQREEEASLREQQEESLRKQQEESLRKQQEENLRKQQEEEASLRKRQEEEASLRKRQEEEASLRKRQEEEASLRKRQEEEASLQKQREEGESLRKQQDEEGSSRKQLQEGKSLRKQREGEESMRKQGEEEESLRKQREEESSDEKRDGDGKRRREQEAEGENLQNQKLKLVEEHGDEDQSAEQQERGVGKLPEQEREESGQKSETDSEKERTREGQQAESLGESKLVDERDEAPPSREQEQEESREGAEQKAAIEPLDDATAQTVTGKADVEVVQSTEQSITEAIEEACGSAESPAFTASASSNDAAGGSQSRQPTKSSRVRAASGMMVGSNSQQRNNPLVSYGFDSEDEEDEDDDGDDDDDDDDKRNDGTDGAANASEAVAKDDEMEQDTPNPEQAEIPSAPSESAVERRQGDAESSADIVSIDVSDDSAGVQVSSSHTTGVFTQSVASPGLVGGLKKVEVTSSSDNRAERRPEVPHDEVDDSSCLGGGSGADEVCDVEPCDQGLPAPNDRPQGVHQAETASSSDESGRSVDENSEVQLHSQSAETASSSAELASSTDESKNQNPQDGASSSSDGLNLDSALRAPTEEMDPKTCVASSSPTQTTDETEQLGQQASSEDACSSSDKLPQVDHEDPPADTSDQDPRTEVQSSSEASSEKPHDASSSSDKKESADSYADSSSPQQTTSDDRVESRTDGESAPSSSDQQTGVADSRIENSAEEPDSEPVRASVESSEEASSPDDNSIDASDDPTRPKCCSSSTASAERSAAPVEEFESGRPRCESTSETNRTSRLDDDDDFEENSQPELPGACTSSHSQQHSSQHAASEQADPLSNAADGDIDISSSNNNNNSSSSNDNNGKHDNRSTSASHQATSEASSAEVDDAKDPSSRPEEKTSISSSDAQSSQRPADFSVDQSSGMAQSSDEPRAQMLPSPLQDYGAIPDGNEVSASSSSSSATGESRVNASGSGDKDSPAPTPSSSSCKPDVKLSSSVEDASSEAIPMGVDHSKDVGEPSGQSPSAEENADSSHEDENPTSSSAGPSNKESKEPSSS